MRIREIHDRAGSPANYIFYIFLLFCYYFLTNLYFSMQTDTSGNSLETVLVWVFRLVLVPLFYAGIYGGILERQRGQDMSGVSTLFNEDTSSLSAFFKGMKKFGWRMMGANFLAVATLFFITFVALVSGWVEQADLSDNLPLLGITSIPYSAFTLFWFAGVVVKRRVFMGLVYGIRTLLTDPFALAIGIIWGMVGFADTLLFDIQNVSTSIYMNGIRAGVLTLGRIVAVVYATAIFEHDLGEKGDEVGEGLASPATISSSSGDGLVKVSIGFSFVSFLPIFHLVALVLGILALKRKRQFVLGSAIACCLGAFITIFYSLLIAGWIITASNPSTYPTHEFLTEVNPEVVPLVASLEAGDYQEITQKLGGDRSIRSDRHWSYDSISALARYYSYDLEGALGDFRLAAEKEPERNEFYYFYGVALLDNDQPELAAAQFQNALTHGPGLEVAQRYLNLIDSTYDPPLIVTSLGFVIILLLSFTIHEFGHAFAAWKLGDDTAKDLGRLTLNPIPHLDLFGSLILPAILLFRGSEFIFGWAKPVPVNPQNFKDPHKDHMRVSFAGPAMNLVVAMASFIILAGIMLFVRLIWPESLSLNFATPFSSVSLVGPPFARALLPLIVFIKQIFYTSLILGVFNLLPVPPLDGSWILSGIFPQRFSHVFEGFRRFGSLIFLILVITPVFDYILSIPISLAWGAFHVLASGMGLG